MKERAEGAKEDNLVRDGATIAVGLASVAVLADADTVIEAALGLGGLGIAVYLLNTR